MIKSILGNANAPALLSRVARWHLRYYTGRRTPPLACGLYITSACNLRCRFCNIWRRRPSFQMPQPLALQLIRELGREKLVYFSISGGEPLLVPYVFDLLAQAKASGILYTHMVSNGWLMDAKKAHALAAAKLTEISFSLDGDKAFHDVARSQSGAHEKVLAAVDHVKTHAPQTKVVLNTILDPITPDQSLKAVCQAERLQVDIKVQPANDHPGLNASEPAPAVKRDLSDPEKKNLLDVIEKLQQHPRVINSRSFLENYKAFLFAPDRLMLSKEDCLFGYHHLEVFNNQAFPCLEALGWQNGTPLKDNSIMDILHSTKYRRKLQDLRSCQGCRKNYYVCYYEPRLNFPLGNFLNTRLTRTQFYN